MSSTTHDPKSHPRLDEAARSAEEALAATRRVAGEAIDGLGASVAELRGAALPAIGRAADQVSAMAHNGLDALRDGSHRVTERARRAGDDTVRYIHHEPVMAMLMAAATGAALMGLVSLLAGRRGRE